LSPLSYHSTVENIPYGLPDSSPEEIEDLHISQPYFATSLVIDFVHECTRRALTMMFRHSSLVSVMFLSGIVVRLFVQWAGMRKLVGTPTSSSIGSNNMSTSRYTDTSMMMDLPLSLLLLSGNNLPSKADEETVVQVVKQQSKRPEETTTTLTMQVLPAIEPEIPSKQKLAKTATTTNGSNSTTTPRKRAAVVRVKKKTPPKRTTNEDRRHRRTAAAAEAAYEYALTRARARVEQTSKNTSSFLPSFLAKNLGELYERVTGQVLPSKRHVTTMRSFKLLNSIRIPKAASSSLSVTARALAGCMPDGYPCCLDDVFGIDACPIANLYCPYVRGCVGHLPDYEFFADTVAFEYESSSSSPPTVTESTITVLRQPVARSVSAFFYKPPHRPDTSCGYTWHCFVKDYLSNPVYSNPMTKMLVGMYAYDPEWRILPNGNITSTDIIDGSIIIDTYENVLQQAKDRLCRMQWFGIAEWPLASALLLYESHPFSKLLPNPVVFGLPPTRNTANTTSTLSRRSSEENKKTNNDAADNTILPSSSSSSSSSSLYASAEAAALRKNTMRAYQEFKSGVFVEGNGTQLLQQENAADAEIYDFARHVFCQRLQDTGLLVRRQGASNNVELPPPSFNNIKNHDDWPLFQGCTTLLNKKTKNAHCPIRGTRDSSNMATASAEEI
jgi:hypothetical protein